MTNGSETEAAAKIVDQVYKNILEKFNPAARHLVAASKSYLKALHGVSAASQTYLDALRQLANLAEKTHVGASSDIGSGLKSMIKSLEDIREHETTVLKAFYVDVLSPLEGNVEKDYKVVQTDYRHFSTQWKSMWENYSRAEADVKKRQRKMRNSKSSVMLDREIKQIRVCDERKLKYETFVETNLRDVLTQERRRYGFILERQNSLCRHLKSLHSTGVGSLSDVQLDHWTFICNTRDTLTGDVIKHLSVCQSRPQRVSGDASCKEVRFSSTQPAIGRTMSTGELDKLSETSILYLTDSAKTVGKTTEPNKSTNKIDDATLQHSALYSFRANSGNQLSFEHGDVIVTAGDERNGWRFGKNAATGSSGWYPVAYTRSLEAPDNPDSTRSDHHCTSTTTTNTTNTTTTNNNNRNGIPFSCTMDRQFRPAANGAGPAGDPLCTFASVPVRGMTSRTANTSRTMPAVRRNSAAMATVDNSGANIQRELANRLQQRQTRCSDVTAATAAPPVYNNELQLSVVQLHSSSDSGFGADSVMTASGVKFNSRASKDSSQTVALTRTKSGLLLLGQAEDRNEAAQSAEAGACDKRTEQKFGKPSSFLSHYVTMDRKHKKGPNSLLKMIGRKGGVKAEAKYSWSQNVGDSLWRNGPPSHRDNIAERFAVQSNECNQRSSPRSLSESDLNDIENGDSFVILQNSPTTTNEKPSNINDCQPSTMIGRKPVMSLASDQSKQSSTQQQYRSFTIDRKLVTSSEATPPINYFTLPGRTASKHSDRRQPQPRCSNSERLATKLKRFNIDPFNYGSYLKNRLLNSDETSDLGQGQTETWSNLWSTAATLDETF